MFFQFSPPKKAEKKVKVQTEEKAAILSLAPFTANPKLFFENVQVGKSAVEQICVKNPTPQRMTVNVQLKSDEELQLSLSWTQKHIQSNEEVLLELTWTPQEAGSWRQTLRFSYGGPPREVPLALKSILPKKKKRKASPPKKGLPRVVAKKTISPVNKRRKSPKKVPNIVIVAPTHSRGSRGKENIVPELLFDVPLSSRRETYVVPNNVPVLEPVFEDSLENSPGPGLSFEGKLKSDSFVLAPKSTPLNSFKPEHCSTDEKSLNSTSSLTGARFCLFPEHSFLKKSPNISGQTYVKNLSSETYVKPNLSSETFTKDLSFHTYNIDDSDRGINEAVTPPSFSKRVRLDSLCGSSVKDTIEANLWATNEPKRRPIPIGKELRLSDFKPTPVKRKSEDTCMISPKRPNLGVPYITEWRKYQISIIDPEFALRLEQHEDNFKKWLNMVLAPPADLESTEQQIDVAKLWRDCLKKSIDITPVGLSCSRLNALRKTFKIFYKTPEIQAVLSKVNAAIESDRLAIRKDRDVHLDLALQTEVMTIILSYNPLWLRLGLETIFGMNIPLRSNSDVIGLTTFLKEWLIRNPLLLKKFKSVHHPRYSDTIKKFILKKFLALVYLLDRAKTNKLIKHDPCLFRKNSEVKESGQALTRFSRDIITSMGDITKYLKHHNYIVEHKQVYLDEFDYSVNFLGADLRDGVRLTRVMEVILLLPNLSKQLRVPAISRLQKVHNVTVAFEAMKASGLEIMSEITPTDIVNGHKEKTLAFLWQLIHKMETPLMVKSASIISRWWRSQHILRKREELRLIALRKTEAAIKIQRWYRKSQVYAKQLEVRRKDAAATKIQSYFRMFIAKRRYQKLKSCVRFVEERYLTKKLMLEERNRFEALKHAAVVIQRRFRANELKKIEEMKYTALRDSAILIQRTWRAKKEAQQFQILKATTIMIQRRFRANFEMKKQCLRYHELRSSVIFLQRKWRATLVMRDDMFRFQVLKSSTILIQKRFRANLEMKNTRTSYNKLKETVIFVQRRWRAILTVKKQMREFQSLKNAAICIQRRFRAKLAARATSNDYQRLKSTVILIQRKWKATLAMRKEKKNYENMKKAVTLIQRRYRETRRAELQFESFLRLKSAVIFIQRQWRAKLEMRAAVKEYTVLRTATIVIQRRFRETVAARVAHADYQKLKQTTIVVQRRWRAKLTMQKEMKAYEILKTATVVIQRRFRATLAAKSESQKFETLRRTTIFVQRQWRAKLAMRDEMNKFQALKVATITIQRRFRANVAAKIESHKFEVLKTATICVQRRWRATLAMRVEMVKFQAVKSAVLVIQRRFRGTMIAKDEHKKFEKLRTATICIQRRWRATLLMKTERTNFETLKKATICVQRRWRAKLAMKAETKKFQALKVATITIQRRFRANVAAKIESQKFEALKTATICVQRRWRAKLAMRVEVKRYLAVKSAVLVIQRRFRATMIAKDEHKKFEKLRTATICIQMRWRATLLMKTEKTNFEALKKATICVQRRWRAKLAMKAETKKFQALKVATITIQRRFRANVAAKIESQKFEALKTATICVQRRWRAKLAMRVEVKKYLAVKSAVLVIQRRLRATMIAKVEHQQFEKLRKAIICIQRRWRATLLMKTETTKFEALKEATLVVQRRFRSNLLARTERQEYETLRKTVIYVQRKWRAKLAMRAEVDKYQRLKGAAIAIQRRYREIVAIKKEEQRKEDCVAITEVQRHVRGFLVRQKFADFLKPEAVAARKLLRTQTKAATLIQSVWRSYKVRGSQTPKLFEIYKKLKLANETAVPENTMRVRCKKAVMQLGKRISLADMLSTFRDLEFITRRCSGTLRKLAPVLPPYLYETICNTNRSMLEMQLSSVATLILLNIYRFEATRGYTWITEYLESVITVMLHCCDKESLMFPSLCTLLYFFLAQPEYKKIILSTHKFKEKMAQIEQMVHRKKRMTAKVQLNYVSLFATSSKTLPIPCDAPDWGLDLKKKPRIFENSVHALDCLLSVLNSSN